MLLSLTITARAPLAFALRKPGTQFRPSLPYVPGAAIFGALGAEHFAGDAFRELRCYNAYPARPGDDWVRPLPASAHVPKRAGDDLRDTLIARACWERQRPAAVLDTLPDRTGKPLEDRRRWPFYTLRDGRLLERDIAQRVLTRVAINRRRGTAEDQRLYSPLVLNEQTDGEWSQFRGSIAIPDDAPELAQALEAITHLGGRQSSGLGAVEIRTAPAQAETGADLAARIEHITEQFRAQAEQYAELRGRHWEIQPRTLFTIGLLSDAILLEQGWLPTNAISGAQLAELTGIEATPVCAFAGSGAVGGWQVGWQRPKPTALATIIGSVFVFEAARPLGPAECERLAELQAAGIGERRQEGYGQIIICDQFHLATGATV